MSIPVIPDCFHRPGRKTRSGATTCRFCGVLIEECPCVEKTHRKGDPNCRACLTSMWVAVVRSRLQTLRDLVA